MGDIPELMEGDPADEKRDENKLDRHTWGVSELWTARQFRPLSGAPEVFSNQESRLGRLGAPDELGIGTAGPIHGTWAQ
jgi:hypothetical protein